MRYQVNSIREDRIETIVTSIRKDFENLKPLYVTQYQNNFSIFSEKYNTLDLNISIGQRVLSDLLRPLPPGEHNKKLIIFYSEDFVREIDENIIEVAFLFLWQ